MFGKLKNILLWSLIFGYLIFILGFVADSRQKVICNAFDIRISDERMNKFVSKKDVELSLDKYKYQFIGMPINKINTMLTEEIVSRNFAVKKVDVFTTVNGKLNIHVQQRKPILRIINERLQNYFIDEDGDIVPNTRQFAAYTIVANGHIRENFNPIIRRNLFQKHNDSIPLKTCIVHDIYKVAMFLKNDDFWNSQIQQIYVNTNNDMVLIPRIGSQNIIFGKADSLEYKFAKLKSMYYTFNVIGWNKYKTINLKYNNQVICTKR